jgi:hypothetical protein
MLQLLLDEHISPVVARETGLKCRGLKIVAFREWRAGAFMGADDRVFLPEAATDKLTLVTYDQRTIRPLLKQWAEQSRDHGGVVFVDEKTIAPQDFGSLIEALSDLWKSERRAAWINRVVFLRKPAS